MNKPNVHIPVDLLRQVLTLDETSGRLYWKARPEFMFEGGKRPSAVACKSWNNRHAGKEALSSYDHMGYLRGCIFGRHVKAHRVIYALLFGEWPSGDIDHINGITSDNRPENLRAVNRSENMKNSSLRADNKTGYTGVSFSKDRGKYRAVIQVNERQIDLGLFDTAEAAFRARQEASKKYGYHKNHGRKSA